MRVPIELIRVGERRREDYGDIEGLAANIAHHGRLIHPVVIDNEHRLIAGARRLRACALLGWEEIEATLWADLSEAQRREIELDENLHRKDLSPYEAARTMVALAEAAAIADTEEFRKETLRKPTGGRPQEPGSLRRVAERIGVTPPTVQHAQVHAETAETFPFMQDPSWKQYHILQAKEHLDRIPEEEREEAARLIDQPGIPPQAAIPMLANLAAMPETERETVYRLSESDDPRDRSLAVTKAANVPAMPDPRINRLTQALAELGAAARAVPDDEATTRIRSLMTGVRAVIAFLKEGASEDGRTAEVA